MLKLKPQNKMILKLRAQVETPTIEEIRSKRARRGIRKGKRGVNLSCKMMSEWWGEIESFTPSGSSGAGNRVGQAGDIITPKLFPFILENKNDESWNMTSFLKPIGARGALSIILKFWRQVEKATSDYNTKKSIHQIFRVPALLLTKNYEDILFVTRKYDFEIYFVYPEDYIINHYRDEFENTETEFVICLLQDILDYNNPSCFNLTN